MALWSGPAWAEGRIATVDLKKIFENYWKRKEAATALEERKAEEQKELKSLAGEFDKANEEYQKLLTEANNQAVSSEERDKSKKAAEEKYKQLKNISDDLATAKRGALERLDAQSKRLSETILDQIRTVVNAKAKQAGYTMVLDTSTWVAGTTPAVLYSNNESDLTTSVLEQLNAAAPADTSKPEEKKDERKKDEKK
jgi:outer membrane protein